MTQTVNLHKFANVLFILAGLIDKGKDVSIETIWDWIEQGALFKSLGEMGEKHGVMGMYHGDEGEFTEYYYNALGRVSEDRPIHVNNSGFAMLIAYTTEMIQAGKGDWAPCEYAKGF